MLSAFRQVQDKSGVGEKPLCWPFSEQQKLGSTRQSQPSPCISMEAVVSNTCTASEGRSRGPSRPPGVLLPAAPEIGVWQSKAGSLAISQHKIIFSLAGKLSKVAAGKKEP